MLELWHEWNSVHSFKVRAVLAEKDLTWTSRPVSLLAFEHLQPEYLRLNPAGVVPTLVDDGRVITESSVICEYLDEMHREPPLLPAEPHARARSRTWLKHFDDVVHPALRAASFPLLYRPRLRRLPRAELEALAAQHPDPRRAAAFLDHIRGEGDEAARASIGTFNITIERIESALEAEWLSGPRFGLADAAMAAFAERLDNLGLERLWPRGSRAAAWRARTLARDSVQAARAPEEERLSVSPIPAS